MLHHLWIDTTWNPGCLDNQRLVSHAVLKHLNFYNPIATRRVNWINTVDTFLIYEWLFLSYFHTFHRNNPCHIAVWPALDDDAYAGSMVWQNNFRKLSFKFLFLADGASINLWSAHPVLHCEDLWSVIRTVSPPSTGCLKALSLGMTCLRIGSPGPRRQTPLQKMSPRSS